MNNLNEIGLTEKDIYAQNLEQKYLEYETSINKLWEVEANNWLPELIREFDNFDSDREIPVLITAKRIMKFLTNKQFDLLNNSGHLTETSSVQKPSLNRISGISRKNMLCTCL